MHHNYRPVSKLIALLVVLLLWWWGLPAQATEAKHYTELAFPPLQEVRPPDYKRFQLQNGLTVYLMEDHEWPLVRGSVLVRTGDRWEPAEKVGLASLTGDVLRTGGTQQHSPEELNQILEQRAAAIEAGIDSTVGSVGFSALSEDLPTVFDLFAEVVQTPAFDSSKLELAKTQNQGAIARRNDNPESIANREFYKLIYGESSPYARTTEYATLANISRADVLGFYQQYFQPQQMILGIVGDFDSQQMRSRLEAKFGTWQPSQPQTAIPPLPTVTAAQSGGVFVVEQPQLSQSNVLLGQLGGKLDSPDVFALYVVNGVMNGLGGRLVNQVRSQQGLAYSVYAYWQPQYDYPGVFVAGGQTRSQTTVPFIQSVKAELKKLQTSPITADELALAKDAILNSFVFNFQDPSQTLYRLMRYDYYGYPSDFLFRYQRGVKAVAIADVQRVAKTYLKPDQMVTLVVGNTQAIQPPLTTLNPNVAAIDVTIPQLKGAAS
ncbi:MAG: insulinase family protein [Aphanocapsa sp. GSE-SYN-MK-11-07L]|jgi:zinc protease|nr:insulinase family protein [Aphanocapsa sp. GSE-SYN-MK-11-07L]